MISRHRTSPCRTAVALALWCCCAAAAQPAVEGRVGVSWDMHTRANSAAADYQALRGSLRLSTQAAGAYGARFHLDARGKKGIEERVDGDNPFANRGRIQRAYVEAVGPGQARFYAGRHYAPLRGIGSYAVDGVSVARSARSWSVRASGGLQVAFYEPNAPVDGSARQLGAEAEWHPVARPYRLHAAVGRDRDTAGRDRLRVAAGGSWQLAKGLDSRAQVEYDPQEKRVWAGKVQAAWRWGRRGHVHLGYARRLATAYPVLAAAEPLQDGTAHALHLTTSLRWRRASARLYARYSTGAREHRSQRLHVAWHRLPFVGWRLQVDAQDSWSPWRRIEQAGLAVQGTGPRRVHFTLGAKQSFFRWNTSRRPEWRARTRPHLRLRYAVHADWSLQLRVEEIIDEFSHVRTRATVGLSHRL